MIIRVNAHLRIAYKAAGQAVLEAAKYALQEGSEQWAHLVPKGAFKNRAADVVAAIKMAQNAVGDNLAELTNGLVTTANNHLGTHTDAFFRATGEVFKKNNGNVKRALAQLVDQVKTGMFIKR